MVPSPPPQEIVEIGAVRALAASGRIVITGGGGGIPVARRNGDLVGVEGVIDKDRTASLAARTIDARGFVIFTEVGHGTLVWEARRNAATRPLRRRSPSAPRCR